MRLPRSSAPALPVLLAVLSLCWLLASRPGMCQESAFAPPAGLVRLIAAYPQFLEAAERADGSEDGRWQLVWKDGTRMDWSRSGPEGAERSQADRLADPDLADMFAEEYPADPARRTEGDPGRIRHEAFFKKMYGASEGQARAAVVPVRWAPGGPPVEMTKVNGAAEALRSVGEEIARLPREKRFCARTTQGGFVWRRIAGEDRLSPHSFGVAVDLAPECSTYWRWAGSDKARTIPREIVEIFERHGFIWGGKWRHVDTMHFEFRPELLPGTACRTYPLHGVTPPHVGT